MRDVLHNSGYRSLPFRMSKAKTPGWVTAECLNYCSITFTYTNRNKSHQQSHSYASFGPPSKWIKPQYLKSSRARICCVTLFSSCVSTRITNVSLSTQNLFIRENASFDRCFPAIACWMPFREPRRRLCQPPMHLRFNGMQAHHRLWYSSTPAVPLHHKTHILSGLGYLPWS